MILSGSAVQTGFGCWLWSATKRLMAAWIDDAFEDAALEAPLREDGVDAGARRRSRSRSARCEGPCESLPSEAGEQLLPDPPKSPLLITTTTSPGARSRRRARRSRRRRAAPRRARRARRGRAASCVGREALGDLAGRAVDRRVGHDPRPPRASAASKASAYSLLEDRAPAGVGARLEDRHERAGPGSARAAPRACSRTAVGWCAKSSSTVTPRASPRTSWPPAHAAEAARARRPRRSSGTPSAAHGRQRGDARSRRCARRSSGTQRARAPRRRARAASKRVPRASAREPRRRLRQLARRRPTP